MYQNTNNLIVCAWFHNMSDICFCRQLLRTCKYNSDVQLGLHSQTLDAIHNYFKILSTFPHPSPISQENIQLIDLK